MTTYHASGSVIFQAEHVPMTLEGALEAKATHLRNRDLWLGIAKALPMSPRLVADAVEIAAREKVLADEMERAIAAVQQKEAA